MKCEKGNFVAMSSADALLECVPNFSHGLQDAGLSALVQSINNVPGQKLLHVDNNQSANRSVFTFAGQPEQVAEAAFQAIKTAAALIDMRLHHGVHPRLGATDVCPLVPLKNCSMQEAVFWAALLAKRVGRELNIPVYLYEYSARKSYRLTLPQIRRGGYEGLADKMLSEKWIPDYGPLFDAANKDAILRTGATVIGARNILVAFNIALDTTDQTLAEQIARRIRSSGYTDTDAEGVPVKRAGMFRELRAIGWYIEDFGCAQVSLNFLDYKTTSPLAVWETVKELAAACHCRAIGCEVIGLIPEQCIREAGMYRAAQQGAITKDIPVKKLIDYGIEHLRLNEIKPFHPEEKILEYALQRAGLT